MGFFSRKPKLHDQALSELSQMFSMDLAEDSTPGRELLDPSRLDYSVESLELVDDYLEQMRQRQLEVEAYMKVVLRTGSYVGEVIRRNAQGKEYHWLDYRGAVSISPMVKDFGESLGTAAVLWDGASGLSFPVGKIVKFLENGREDSVKFFARVTIANALERK
jgi:hypothetical protein